MSKLKRPIEDPVHSDIERPITRISQPFPENQYFVDDGENDAYFVNDDKDNNYVTDDE